MPALSITKKFRELKNLKRTAFMPFLAAGHPNYKKSLDCLIELSKQADFLEIGFPYSDPLADGPVIQAADSLALKNGMTTAKVFSLISELRKKTAAPVIVLVYANLVYQQGIDNFYRRAKKAGIDGVLIPDAPFEEAGEFVLAAKKYSIAPIFLVTQTTTLKRLKNILSVAEGFLYLVSVLGVTGARKNFNLDTLKFISFIKKHTTMPIAVGFGVSVPAQLKELKAVGADGVIVGSALVKLALNDKYGLLKLAKELENAC